MTDNIPADIPVDIPVDVTPGRATVDLPAPLEEGKAYRVTFEVATDGTQTVSTVDEIPQGPSEPASGYLVIRNKSNQNAYLGHLNSTGTWTVAFDPHDSWEEVLRKFPATDWDYSEVIFS